LTYRLSSNLKVKTLSRTPQKVIYLYFDFEASFEFFKRTNNLKFWYEPHNHYEGIEMYRIQF